MKNKKIFGMLSAGLLLALFLLSAAGCRHEVSPDENPNGAGNTTVTATPSPVVENDTKPTPTEVVPPAEPTPTASVPDTEITATPIPDDSEQPTPTPKVAEPTDVPPTPTPTLRDSTAERDEYWSLTYLVWLPEFTSGSFDSKSSDDTYDYAVFTDVTESDVSDYIDLLTEKGFTNVYRSETVDGVTEYIAGNADDWRVALSFKNGSLTIGSGFEDGEEPDSDEEARMLAWSSTVLEYLPIFEGGQYAGFETEEDDVIFCYAYFNNVTENDVRKYVVSLQEAGYIYGIDEGDTDGIIWFMALNEDNLSCYVAYDNNIVKIGCGYEE